MLVDKSQNILILKTDDEIVKTYIVSTGANNSTPVGTFRIVNKLVNPTWYKAGAVVPASSPENVLGTRWLGFNLPGYGIHGTTEPQNLGKQVTQGCVRLSNQDVEELYAIVPIGTEITIVD
jgi:lipoprotein-anchoring transpeptidase ErfK/SrfK